MESSQAAGSPREYDERAFGSPDKKKESPRFCTREQYRFWSQAIRKFADFDLSPASLALDREE